MHIIYLLARTYPYWAFPSAVIAFELVRFYKRKKQKQHQIASLIVMIFLLSSSAYWFIARGDINSDKWIDELTGNHQF
jgi:hypothetical protein